MSYPHFSRDCGDYHDLVVDFHGVGPRPTITVLCGSTRFRDDFARVNRELTAQGVIVVAPGVFGHSGDPLTDDEKALLDELHKRKIDLADDVLVVSDASGYYGESTRSEIEYARAQRKPVRFMVPPVDSDDDGWVRHPGRGAA